MGYGAHTVTTHVFTVDLDAIWKIDIDNSDRRAGSDAYSGLVLRHSTAWRSRWRVAGRTGWGGGVPAHATIEARRAVGNGAEAASTTISSVSTTARVTNAGAVVSTLGKGF